MQMSKVLVVGGGGRVGYPFAHYCASKGHVVIAYDRRQEAFDEAKSYVEEAFSSGPSIKETANYDHYLYWLRHADIVVIMIGTPIDAEGNPRVDGLNAIRKDITYAVPSRSKPLLVILRSTVAPGVTEEFTRRLNEDVFSDNRHDLHVAFCPERIAQGKTFIEMPKLPQLIGADSDEAAEAAMKFFFTLTATCFRLSTKGAELGKLMTNMYRYINFAIANEFQMIAHHHGQDFDKIRGAVNYNYPRMALPKAGPNSAGPCLVKDGAFLVSHIPYNELVRSSFAINEGMPGYIVEELIEPHVSVNFSDREKPIKVAILGMAFKADNDDTRFSLSFKLKKILERKGYEVICHDPYDQALNDDDERLIMDAKIVVLMTPHSYYDELFYKKMISEWTYVIDLWKHFNPLKEIAYQKEPI